MVNTPVNFVPMFKILAKEEIIYIESKTAENLDKIQKLIINRIPFHENRRYCKKKMEIFIPFFKILLY